MRLTIQPTSAPKQFIGLAWTSIGIIGFLLARLDEFTLSILPRCGFKSLTGLPCPSCGATHSAIFFSHFELYDSFLANPLYFLLFLLLILYSLNAIAGALFRKNLYLDIPSTSKKRLFIIGLILVALNWIFLLLRAIL